jgi:hypothetical protein
MRAFVPAHSPHTDDPAGEVDSAPGLSRRRRWGVALAAAIVFPAAVIAVAATPAYAVNVSYGCETGSYKPALGRLGAFNCDGSGATNLYVAVSYLTVVNGGPIDVAATLYCTDFGLSGVPGHWAGNCVVYSYP